MNLEADIVAAAAEAMSDDELAAAIAVLHAHERELLLADDLDRAFRVMRDKFVLVSIQNERQH
ncbi:hypothetical protein [Rhodococcus sp. RDE2]|uniref:hypothetical protein n=1 Tax=Rhodococcus sp. RDE2 TaxID=2885078 RepID=UPI001E355907|nr:hypothetical protein [Rhodococcus sp. RDE2]BDB63531.1 hypothetical protein RDE2_53250 [Rhodococcus sp. RDE2]